MKNLILLLLFFSNTLLAYSPAEYHNQKEEYLYGTDETSIKLKELENQELKAGEVVDDKTTKQTIEQLNNQAKEVVKEMTSAEKTKKINDTQYFYSNYEYDDTGLYCPPISKWLTHFPVVKSIDFNTGTITCQAVELPHAYSNMSNELKNVTPFTDLKVAETKTFTNKKYVEMLSKLESPQNTIKEEAIAAANLHNDQLLLAKQTVQQKYANLNTVATGERFLNLSEIVDAVLTMNEDIIDIPASLEANDIVLKPGYIQSYKAAHIREKVEENNNLIYEITKEINTKWFSFVPVLFDPQSKDSTDQKKSDAAQMLGTHLNSLLYFVVKYYKYLDMAIDIFLIGAILFALYNVAHYFFERAGNENERKNLKFKAGVTATTVIFLLAITTTDPIYEDEYGNYSVELSRLQNFVTVLSVETNYIANRVTEAVIDSYVNGMFGNHTIMTPADMQKMAKNKAITEKIREYQANHMARCYQTFSIGALKSDHKDTYEKISDTVFIPDNAIKSKNGISPYNTLSNGGYVINTNWAGGSIKTTEIVNGQVVDNKNWNADNGLRYSFDACNQIESSYKNNLVKLDILNKKIDNFNDVEQQQKEFDEKGAIVNKLYLDYAQYGYIAAPLLAVVATYEKVYDLPEQKAEEWLSLISSRDYARWGTFAIENVLFSMTIGTPVHNFVEKIVHIVMNGAVGWIPILGNWISTATSQTTGFVSATFFVDYAVELIPAIRNLFIFAIGTVMIMLFFIAKFAVFWLLPFAVIYAFLTQSIEKVSKQIIKVIITFMKPVIFIVVLFLTLFVVEFLNNFMAIIIDEMTELLSGGDGAIETITAFFIKNIAQIFAIIIEFIIAYQLVVNGTKSIISWFEVQTNDLADVLADGVSQVVQNKVIK